MNETVTELYQIPERNFPNLRARIDVLNKRAVKLGCSHIQIQQTGEVMEYAYAYQTRNVSEMDAEIIWRRTGEVPPHNYTATGEVRRVFLVRVIGQAPKFSGWTLAATIQTSEAGNILRCVPGLSVALKPEYRTCAPACDHCKADRLRKDTFIVLHEDGTQKQVGRQCIRDFLGHTDPERLARIAELNFSLTEICQSEEDGLGGGAAGFGQAKMVNTLAYLSHVAAVSDGKPFITSKMSKEPPYYQQTSISADINMFPPRNFPRRDIIEVTDKHKATAEKAVALVLEKLGSKAPEKLNEFEHNLLIVAKSEAIESRTYGIAAYLVHYYRREMEEIVKRAARPVSVHFGELKKRYKAEKFVYTGTSSFPTDFGTKYIHRFLKDGGNVSVWKTTTEELAEVNSGDVLTMDYTVKEHGDYKGTVQTIITRCKILSVEPQQQAA